mmetsp:Transcript_91211/g.292875  ORF Transcript_91211/g.292875 Transcript_91211/m.292875 type:complete len:324 (+) Transcript_91211:434-1405(+)
MLQVWRGRRQEADELFGGAVDAGLLRDTRQRPLEVLDRSLPARGPWVEESSLSSGVVATIERLRGHLPDFWEEYLKWNRTRAQDAELDKEGLADPHGTGRWLHYWIYHPRFERGVWNGACHYKTPKTCSLLKELNSTAGGVRILRVDFDILEPGARVRPHCHDSNQELLLDICLRAPRQRAALVRSGEEERAWSPGDVVVSDPSYEHEELNLGKARDDAAQAGVDYAQELRAFYSELGMLEDKEQEIPSILAKWQGREEKMVRELRKKYASDRGERVLLRILISHPDAKSPQRRSAAAGRSQGAAPSKGAGGLTVQSGSEEEL